MIQMRQIIADSLLRLFARFSTSLPTLVFLRAIELQFLPERLCRVPARAGDEPRLVAQNAASFDACSAFSNSL